MPKPVYIRAKRVLDFIGALICLVLFSPVILVTALLVKIFLGSPVIFKQARPGLHEEIFTLYKFRSMKNIDETKGLITDAERLGTFGRILRSTSLDELPSLVNVIKGDMSFVGPRPLLVEYLPLYSNSEKQRHTVRPGITGLAQSSGRNMLNWEEKFILDLEYTKKISFWFDLLILKKTIVEVLKRSNINSPGSDTSPKFSK